MNAYFFPSAMEGVGARSPPPRLPPLTRLLPLWFYKVGDKVEVAWSGKFRLESLKVYNGMAWWLAHVVAKSSQPGYYQVS